MHRRPRAPDPSRARSPHSARLWKLGLVHGMTYTPNCTRMISPPLLLIPSYFLQIFPC